MKSVILLAVVLAFAAATDKGDKGGSYYPQSYGYPTSYAPVYHQQAYDSYAVRLPQYQQQYNFKTYAPITKYYPVKSVPVIYPNMAFYPSYPSYGGGGGYY